METVAARESEIPELPLTVPRIRARRSLRGQLHRRFYAVGLDQVVIDRRRVLAADELREIVGLDSDQQLALMLFGRDDHLEVLWARRNTVFEQIGEAAYDVVAPPSFSARFNFPPPEFLYNAKRSLVAFEDLQLAGACTAPRLTWLSRSDVGRAARWCNANTNVRLITLDLAIKHHDEWHRQLVLLRAFDQLTDQRLLFFIHGPAAESRLRPLFRLLGKRLRLSGSGAISKPRQSSGDFERFAEEEDALAARCLEEAAAESINLGFLARRTELRRLPVRAFQGRSAA